MARAVPIKPTMGVTADSYSMLLNAVPRGGKITRRPSIKAVTMGYSSSYEESPALYPTGSHTITNDNQIFDSQWLILNTYSSTNYRILAPGGVHITSSNLSEYITGHASAGSASHAHYKGQIRQITAAAMTNGSKYPGVVSITLASPFSPAPSTSNNDVAGTPTDKINILPVGVTTANGYHQDTRTLHYSNPVVEGIDCAIVNGKVVAVYLNRVVEEDTSLNYGHTGLYFGHSYHHPSDPTIGYLRSSVVVGSKNDDAPDNWYKLAGYWNRRIVPTFTDYIICGKHIGPEILDATKDSDGNHQVADVAGCSLLFDGFPVKMYAPNETQKTINRVDPYATIYCTHSPKNSFAHNERNSGQTIWYGFLDGDDFSITSEVPAETALLMAYFGDIGDGRDTIFTREYDLWYSEPANPMSLSIVGLLPVVAGSNNPEVIGLADYKNGTAVFTRDTIQFMRGIGADTGSNAASRTIISQGVGSDSRWSIKNVGNQIAFANKAGLWILDENGKVQELTQFRELFSEEGVDCSRGPYHWSITGDHSPDTTEYAANSHADLAYNTFDSQPWRTYKIDQSRLDRAVAGVWDDLYLLFVSLDSDPYQEDNRLVLCWNWRENLASCWLLPKNMGVRGWAYDGSLSTPYVMTRYGLARFEGNSEPDTCYTNSGPTDSSGDARTGGRGGAGSDVGKGWVTTINETHHPMPFILGQGQFLPESGDAVVAPQLIIQHETRHDYKKSDELFTGLSLYSQNDGAEAYLAIFNEGSGNVTHDTHTYTSGDDDYKMKVRIWSAKAELNMSDVLNISSSTTFNKINMSNTSIKPLDNLISEDKFKNWRDRHARGMGPAGLKGIVYESAIGTTDNSAKHRVPRAIRKLSEARSGFTGTRMRFQFSTAAPGKVFSVQMLIEGTAPKGERG